MRNRGADMIKLTGTFSDFAIVPKKKFFCIRNVYVLAGKVVFIEIVVSNHCCLTLQF